MKLVTAKAELITPPYPIDGEDSNLLVEIAARTCYKSESDFTHETAAAMIRKLIQRKHFAMLEHASATVRFTVDRGVSHELVRHRLASFAQESTRFCNYSKEKFGNEISVIDIRPGMDHDPNIKSLPEQVIVQILAEWIDAMGDSERHYMKMLELGATSQIARGVLPTSLKTEIIMTANLREWRHFMELRYKGTTGAPHPQMLEVTEQLFPQFKRVFPDFFFDMD